MVDVSVKEATVRVAIAQATLLMQPETAEMIRRGDAAKGDVLAVSRLAAIAATKWTSHLIPLCHAIPVESVQVDFLGPRLRDDARAELVCTVTVKTTAKTGVEMEAMTGATIGCLTVYDMVKSVDRAVSIGPVVLIEKSGGKSGHFQQPATE